MEFWALILVLVLVVPMIILWLLCMVDVATRKDIGGGRKALWLLLIVLAPLIGALIYVLVRPVKIIPRRKRVHAPEPEAA